MLTEIVVGGATSLVNLVIHALLITAASHACWAFRCATRSCRFICNA